ncbi:MAG: hypothetical protein QMD92_03820 [bacterium]|nr:hypothetical protein [bacterium]
MCLLWTKLIVCALVIILSGYKITKYGSVIANITGIGGLWIGTMILAAITSLPEVVASISSVILVKSPDLALGNVLGSNLFNLTIIVFMDFIYKKKPLLGEVKERHILPLGFGMLLASVVAFSLMTNFLIKISKSSFSLPVISHVGVDSLLLVLIYIISVKLIFNFEHQHNIETEDSSLKNNNLIKNILLFSLFSVIIVISSIFLTKLADEVAYATNLGHTLVGSTLLAITTSLPEIVVSISAVRMGEIDIGLGNALGSNVSNMTIIFLSDLFYYQGSIFSSVNSSHILTAICQIIMYCVVLISIIYKPANYKPTKRFLNLGWGSILILALYLLSIITLYKIK